jgi:RES domain-containing protein
VLATAEVPESLSRKRVEVGALPADWRDVPAPRELAQIGDEFAKKAENCLLFVPSALAVSENNVLINPQHPEFKRITVNKAEPLQYDPRMFRKTTRRRRH